MNHQKIVTALTVVMLSLSSSSVQAKDMDTSAMEMATVNSLGWSLAALNSSLAEHAYQGLPAAQAHLHDAALVSYLSGLGLQHTWQMQVSGDVYDAWYTAEADITVIVLHEVQDANGMNAFAYVMPGRVRKGQQVIY